jgi:hypothetical protein
MNKAVLILKRDVNKKLQDERDELQLQVKMMISIFHFSI